LVLAVGQALELVLEQVLVREPVLVLEPVLVWEQGLVRHSQRQSDRSPRWLLLPELISCLSSFLPS